MFSKLALFTAATMAVFVAAAPALKDSCNTGTIHCCGSLYEAESEGYTAIVGLIGAAVGPVTGQLGFNCSPLSLAAIAGGTKCNAQPACCDSNKINGLVNVGCSPLDIGL